MTEEHKLIGKTYICISREYPAKDPTDEKEEIETVDVGLLINNDDVDWDKYEGKRTVQVHFQSEEEKKSWIPFVKPKKVKVDKTVDGERHTKNADLMLKNVQKPDVIEHALATLGKPGDVPLTIEVYHDVGHYDPDDLQAALSVRAIHEKMFPDLKIMGHTKQVVGNHVVFTGEIIPD
jgi:hypothetical protein